MIYHAIGTHLGDCWSSLNYVLFQDDPCISMYFLSHSRGWKKRNAGKHFRKMIPLFKDGDRIKVTEELPTVRLTWRGIYNVPGYHETVYPWAGEGSKKVAYQFNGRNNGFAKNCKPWEEAWILEVLCELGYEPVQMGLPKSLKQSIKDLSRCCAFVGVESGFSVVSQSIVGLPITIIRNQIEEESIRHSQRGDGRIVKDAAEYIALLKSGQIAGIG